MVRIRITGMNNTSLRKRKKKISHPLTKRLMLYMSFLVASGGNESGLYKRWQSQKKPW